MADWHIGSFAAWHLGTLASWQLGSLAAWKLVNSHTIGKTTTTTTTCPVDHHVLDDSMGMATLVATMEGVAAMARALVLFAVLPGTRPSNALRQVDASVPLLKETYW